MPYDVVFYQRGADRRAPKELRNIHPLGKSPVITDGDITVAESGAIMRVYLLLLLLVGPTDQMAAMQSTLSTSMATDALPHLPRVNSPISFVTILPT